MNTITICGFRGKLDKKSDKFAILTLKEMTNRKKRDGGWETGKTFHNIMLFERDMKFIEKYTEDGQACTVLGELIVEEVEIEGVKRRFYKILPRNIFWAPKKKEDGDERTAEPAQSAAAYDDSDCPF